MQDLIETTRFEVIWNISGLKNTFVHLITGVNGTVILNGTEGYPVICQVSGFEIVAVSKVFQTPEGQRETGIIYAEENVYIRRYESGISFLSFYVETR